ncbi:hypothetical protein E8E11_010184 [Didymella keratinophila]|nr:hypothetical protein E8E11_010184 [Didymella keratinophila]
MEEPETPVAGLSVTPGRPRSTSKPQSSEPDTSADGGFQFIVGSSPEEMRSKKYITAVRKKAMQQYLAKDGIRKKNLSTQKQRYIAVPHQLGDPTGGETPTPPPSVPITAMHAKSFESIGEPQLPLSGSSNSLDHRSQRSAKVKRRKHRPTHPDWVLIREMDSNRPEIARAVAQEGLESAPESEASSDEEVQNLAESDMAALPSESVSSSDPATDYSTVSSTVPTSLVNVSTGGHTPVTEDDTLSTDFVTSGEQTLGSIQAATISHQDFKPSRGRGAVRSGSGFSVLPATSFQHEQPKSENHLRSMSSDYSAESPSAEMFGKRREDLLAAVVDEDKIEGRGCGDSITAGIPSSSEGKRDGSPGFLRRFNEYLPEVSTLERATIEVQKLFEVKLTGDGRRRLAALYRDPGPMQDQVDDKSYIPSGFMAWGLLSNAAGYDSDNEPLSAYAESIFSQESAGSSATGMSAGAHGYTDIELETATKQLVDVFSEDVAIGRMYQLAIENPHIGPERLKRNLYRLVKIYAQNLRKDAKGELERLASQLVAVKARYVTQCVMEKFHTKPIAQRNPTVQANDENSDGEKSEGNSDDEDAMPPIDEDRFEDIVVLRQFLVGSAAFGIFQEQLKSFAQPKMPRQPPGATLLATGTEDTEEEVSAVEYLTQEQSSEKRLPQMSAHVGHFELTKRYGETLLIGLGLLQPTIPPGMIRVRWSCKCGHSSFDDFREYQSGAVDELAEEMQRRAVVKVDPPAQLPVRHLMACIHRTKYHVELFQDQIQNITSDKDLFRFLEDRFKTRRGR